MNRQTWGVAAIVVAVILGGLGVGQGLIGEHGSAVPSVAISLLALAVGAGLLKE